MGSHHTHTPLGLGQMLTCKAGPYVVAVQRIRLHAYAVTVYRDGTLRVDEDCRSYVTEAQARSEARRLVLKYRAEDAAERLLSAGRAAMFAAEEAGVDAATLMETTRP